MAKQPMRNSTRTPKTKAKEISFPVTGMDQEGRGLGSFEGKPVVIPHVLPGETVVARISHEGQHRIFATSSRVTGAWSPDRVRPVCSQAVRCQGCLLAHCSAGKQLDFKKEKVRDALAWVPDIKQAELLPCLPSPVTEGYRTTAKLAIGKFKGEVQIGIYQRHTHRVFDTTDCPVHHPLINRITAVLKEEIARLDISVYNQQTNSGLLRYVAIKVAPHSNQALVTFITGFRDIPNITGLAKWLCRHVPEVIGVHQNVNPSEGNVIFGERTYKMFGKEILLDRFNDFSVGLKPTSFVQVNHLQAENLYRLVRDWAGSDTYPIGFDLYCGVGIISLHLADRCQRMIGMEYVTEAILSARDNAYHNRLGNLAFQAGDTAELLPALDREIPEGGLVVLNPPRTGCREEVLLAVAALAPRMILYVSCNPLTLASDLKILHQKGFKATRIQPIDMFPHTEHVETLVQLLPA